MSEPEVLTRIEGRVGRITLNRPAALHALTTNMCRLMTDALLAWRDDPAVELVLIDHSGERGFCAGGDIRMLAESGAGDGRLAREFFFTEYRLNHLLFDYPKPTLAIMDGVTMGGGVGLSQPCRYPDRHRADHLRHARDRHRPVPGRRRRLVSCRRMPDQLGLWLALTGARIKAADCELLGIATDYRAERAGGRSEGRRSWPIRRPSETLLTEVEADAGRPPIAQHQDEIARLFAGDSVEAIVAALEAADTDWAREQLKVLATKSPQTLKVAFRQLRLGAAATELRRATWPWSTGSARGWCSGHDFLEGVRAVIVDKDNAPKWNPPALELVGEDLLDGIFAALPSEDEWSPLP